MKQISPVRGCEPRFVLTLSKTGVIYLPYLTYARLFSPHASVRLYYDRDLRMVGIEPCGNGADNAVAITKTARGLQIRCGSLLRQEKIKLTGKVQVPALTRQGKCLVFPIPKKAEAATGATIPEAGEG